ncbi:hypothetical protein HYW20_02830 [Candidatus Woesearchaeota archaeon]|nr:hypothetical protein [Candidatus Woesearchaeota archaeon]
MPKTIFAVDTDIEKIVDYQFTLSPKLNNGLYTLTTFRNPWSAYYKMSEVRPGPDLLITAFGFDDHTFMSGPTLIREVHKLGTRTKFIMSDAMHESNARPVLDELKRDGIDVDYIPYYSVEGGLGDLVTSLIGE